MELAQLIKIIHNSQKTLWILCGLPYSGKTYLSKKIIEGTPVAYICIDHILAERGFDWDANRLPKIDEWEKIFEVSYERLKIALKRNMNVLYDSTNHTKASRDALRKQAQKIGAEVRVIFVDIPIETLWKRWKENALQKNRSVVSKELVEQTIQTFEKPTADENIFLLLNL